MSYLDFLFHRDSSKSTSNPTFTCELCKYGIHLRRTRVEEFEDAVGNYSCVGYEKKKRLSHLSQTHGLGENVNAGPDKKMLEDFRAALTRSKNIVPINQRVNNLQKQQQQQKELHQQKREDALLIAIADCALPFAIVKRESFRLAVCDQRSDFKMPICDPETAASKMVFLKERLQEKFLKKMQAECERCGAIGVSIAADATTVWQGRYVALVVHVDEWSVLFACDGDDDPLFAGEFTGDKLTDFFNKYCDLINATGCYVQNIVTDNGANFLKAARQMKSTFSINCIAHGLNLCIQKAVQDITMFANAFELAKTYHSANKMKASCEFAATRWGSAVRLMEAVSDHFHEVRKKNKLQDLAKRLEVSEKNNLDASVEGLKPFVFAIDQVQGNGANVFSAIQALARIHSHLAQYRHPTRGTDSTLIGIFKEQLVSNLLSDPMLMGCWFSGCVNFKHFPILCSDVLPSMVAAAPMRELARLASKTIVERFQAQDVNLTRYPQKAPMQAIDLDSMKKHIADIKNSCAYIGAAAEVIMFKMKVTEADAERWFSRLKWTVPRLRSNITTERAGAQIVVSSIHNFLKEYHPATVTDVDVTAAAASAAAAAAAIVVEDDDDDVYDEECPEHEMFHDEEEQLDEEAAEAEEDEEEIQERTKQENKNVATFITHWLTLIEAECKLAKPRNKKLSAECAGCNRSVASHGAAHYGKKMVCCALNCGYMIFEGCCNAMQLDPENYRCPKHHV